MPKLTLAVTKVNDYICFTSIDNGRGLPAGHFAAPGHFVYYRITEKLYDTGVVAVHGSERMVFEDRYFDDNNVYTAKAQFPCILEDWRLRVLLPTGRTLPWRLRAAQFFRNLFRRRRC